LKRNFNKPPAIGIGKLLRRAHMAFSRELRLRLATHDVSFGEFIHLEKLWYEDGLNQTEISRRVGVETASSTTTLDRLEKRGFVRRVRNGADRRNINLFLTGSGADLRDKLLGCAKTVNLIARSGLTKREVATFFELMAKIAQNLETVDERWPRVSRADRTKRSGTRPDRSSDFPRAGSRAPT
jgi:DNA-binding MarR family transcriptional regulator